MRIRTSTPRFRHRIGSERTTSGKRKSASYLANYLITPYTAFLDSVTSSSAMRSATSHSRVVTPAAIAGQADIHLVLRDVPALRFAVQQLPFEERKAFMKRA